MVLSKVTLLPRQDHAQILDTVVHTKIESDLEQLTFSKPRITTDEDMYVAPCWYAILAASILLDTTKEGKEQASLDELMPTDSRAEGVDKVAKLESLHFLVPFTVLSVDLFTKKLGSGQKDCRQI